MARATARCAGSERAPSLMPGVMNRHSTPSSGSTPSRGIGAAASFTRRRSSTVTGSRPETIWLNAA